MSKFQHASILSLSQGTAGNLLSFECGKVKEMNFTVPRSRAGSAREAVADALREVIEPDFGINVVDMGLVYAIDVYDYKVVVKLSLPTARYATAAAVKAAARAAILTRVPDVLEAEVYFVWAPHWKQSMVSDEARRRLGWLNQV